MKMDFRLTTTLAKWHLSGADKEILAKAQAAAPAGKVLTGKHPDVKDLVKVIPDDCLMCHNRESWTAPPFSRMLHAIHLVGGKDNHFLTMIHGTCTNCHKLDEKTGTWRVEAVRKSSNLVYIGSMKITFIYPKFEKFLETYPQLAEMPAVAATWAFRMPPAMGIPILANLLPPDISWKVIDQNIEPIDYSDDADIIAISYFTPQAGFAYEIGDEFLRRGKTVIAGGMHPSTMPGEAAHHCTSLCIGEADTIWPEILCDVRRTS